jgi:hypothetical protein
MYECCAAPGADGGGKSFGVGDARRHLHSHRVAKDRHTRIDRHSAYDYLDRKAPYRPDESGNPVKSGGLGSYVLAQNESLTEAGTVLVERRGGFGVGAKVAGSRTSPRVGPGLDDPNRSVSWPPAESALTSLAAAGAVGSTFAVLLAFADGFTCFDSRQDRRRPHVVSRVLDADGVADAEHSVTPHRRVGQRHSYARTTVVARCSGFGQECVIGQLWRCKAGQRWQALLNDKISRRRYTFVDIGSIVQNEPHVGPINRQR